MHAGKRARRQKIKWNLSVFSHYRMRSWGGGWKVLDIVSNAGQCWCRLRPCWRASPSQAISPAQPRRLFLTPVSDSDRAPVVVRSMHHPLIALKYFGGFFGGRPACSPLCWIGAQLPPSRPSLLLTCPQIPPTVWEKLSHLT